jgi:prepilin-type N-terminal cleavage/methylation domain-containing protein
MKKGFTLIELLVVIAIIALLMAIMLPSLNRARNQARAVVCQSNLKQWGTTLALYAEDNKGRLPHDSHGGIWLLRGPQLNKGDPNTPILHHNLTTKGISLCPMATKIIYKVTTPYPSLDIGTITYIPGSTFGAWEITHPAPAFSGSYGFNNYMFLGSFSIEPYPDAVNIYTMKNRASFPILLDCGNPFGYIGEREGPSESEDSFGNSFCINRHDGFVNGLFLDWSIRKIGLKQLWTLKWHEDFDTRGPWTKAGGVQPDDWPPWMRGFKDY